MLEPKAFTLYRQGKTQADIAEVLGVSPQTITSWKKKYDWDSRLERMSASTRRSADKLREIIANEIDAMQDGSRADHVFKLSLVLDKFEGMFDRLAFTLEMMEEFNGFLETNYPALLPDFHEVLAPFIQHVGKKYGN